MTILIGAGGIPVSVNPKSTGVIAVGNPYMGDDGIGHHLLESLEDVQMPEGVFFETCDSGGMALLNVLRGYDRAIIVDAVDFGGSPGEVLIFSPNEARSAKHVPAISTHESDALETIALSQKLGEMPESVLIFAVQPATLEPCPGLSPVLESRLHEMADALFDCINRTAQG